MEFPINTFMTNSTKNKKKYIQFFNAPLLRPSSLSLLCFAFFVVNDLVHVIEKDHTHRQTHTHAGAHTYIHTLPLAKSNTLEFVFTVQWQILVDVRASV